ncbi:MAG: AIR synthase-related protein, partial [Woeseiaceae bacterium]
GAQVELDPQLKGAPEALLCDPQTSGGLLVACAEDAVAGVMEVFERTGFTQAAVIGQMTNHRGQISITF